jgi:hypothetical protein
MNTADDENLFLLNNCDVSDIFTEINRFMYHILLIHLITCSIDNKEQLFGMQLLKTLFITALAIVVYHVFFKKIMKKKLKNIHDACDDKK